MKVLLHGGFCCGIKHIAGVSLPEYSAEPRTELKGEATSYKRHTLNAVNDMHRELYGEDFFCEAAPMEKHPERLKRMVDFVKNARSHGLIEVVIQKVNQKKWVPFLEELGFKMVSEFKNGNTSCLLQVWHLIH